MKAIVALLLLVATDCFAAKSSSPDFSSTAGFDRTCATLRTAGTRHVMDDRERVAQFICGAIDLAKDAATWFEHNHVTLDPQGSIAMQQIHARAEQYLGTIAGLRTLLEGVRGQGPFLTIAPGNWQIDFNGDGRVSLLEQHLFWIPKRGVDAPPLDTPTSEDGYRSRYTNPVINVDRSDVYWAIAYLDFAEAALNIALAYDWNPAQYQEATLINRERIAKVAYARMLEGIRYSTRLRESLLHERHDKQEWIPNPEQVDTAFPLRMDTQTFTTWGTLLQELDALLRGKTLLGGQVDSGERRSGARDLAFGFCAPGEGLDVRGLFTQPVSRLFDAKQMATRCAKPTPERPLCGLAPLISASFKRNAGNAGAADSGEWTLLRHLYWVN